LSALSQEGLAVRVIICSSVLAAAQYGFRQLANSVDICGKLEPAEAEEGQ
jgi:hypothetical protein